MDAITAVNGFVKAINENALMPKAEGRRRPSTPLTGVPILSARSMSDELARVEGSAHRLDRRRAGSPPRPPTSGRTNSTLRPPIERREN